MRRIAPPALLLSLSLSVASSAAAATRPLITRPVDETRRVVLYGNTRAAARHPENDRGPVEDSLMLDHMLLQLARPAATEAELTSLIDAMHTPGSPQFHRWLTPAGFGARFGLAPGDLAAITRWLGEHGFTVHEVYGNGTIIEFSGTAGQVREAFHTEIHNLEVNGDKHVANVSDPEVPAALAPAIRGIVSLNDFRPHAMHKAVAAAHLDPHGGGMVTGEAASADYTFNAGSQTYQAVTPGDLAAIYSLNKLFSAGYAGQGQTVAVIEDTDVYSTADWKTFRSAFGLSKYTAGNLVQVHPGNCADPGVNGDDGEAILDAEYASAAAPSATVELASCADSRTTFGGLLALEGLLNGSKAPPAAVSISYGECEAENGAAGNAAFSALYQQAVAEGVSVFVSAGDEGAAGCDVGQNAATHGTGVNGFASTAYNVAVGGTDFGDTLAGTNASYWTATDTSTYESAKSYIDEIPWNDSCAGSLLSKYLTGSATAYGSKGFCNSATGEKDYLSTDAASGGPSSCYSGVASVSGVTGGSCKGNPRPSWQTGVAGLPNDGVRDLPDVSLFAANGIWGHYFIYCYSDVANGGTPCKNAPSGWSGAGGTSFSAPILAGIQALVDQKTGARQGNPNPVYYKLAAAEYTSAGLANCNSSKGAAVASSCIFYDVTQGDIDVNCTGLHSCYLPGGTQGVLSTSGSAYKPAYAAAKGYDFATGIGSLNAYNLAMNWPKAAKVNVKPVGGAGPK